MFDARETEVIYNYKALMFPMHLYLFDVTLCVFQYLLGGLAQIDVNDWRMNTELRGYIQTDNTIVWFWKVTDNSLYSLTHYLSVSLSLSPFPLYSLGYRKL